MIFWRRHLSLRMTKPTKWHLRPAKTQISLGIRPVWSEFSLSAWRKLGSLATHWMHNEDSDQTGRMPNLIWVIAGRTCHFVGFVMKRLILFCIWAAPSEFVTYRLCEQRRFRRACASAQSRQNLRCSLIQTVSQEEPSDRKPDPWPLWMAGHAQLKFVMTECSKTQIRLTGLILSFISDLRSTVIFADAVELPTAFDAVHVYVPVLKVSKAVSVTELSGLTQALRGALLPVWKFPKYSDTQTICCNYPKSWTRWRFLKSNDSKRCRGICKQCRPWSDCSSSLIWVCTVCPDLSVRKLGVINF